MWDLVFRNNIPVGVYVKQKLQSWVNSLSFILLYEYSSVSV